MGTVTEEWVASARWLDGLRESEPRPLPGPELVCLESLMDLTHAASQLEVATGLLETASYFLVAGPGTPLSLNEKAAMLASEFFKILGQPNPDSTLEETVLLAGLQSLAVGEAISAPSILGPGSLWACPIQLHFEDQVHGKGALVSFAFSPRDYPPVSELVRDCPIWLGSRALALEQAWKRLADRALPPARLGLVRRHIELLAQGLSSEISARYEALLAFQSLTAQGVLVRHQHQELAERNRVLDSLTREYAVEALQRNDDRERLEMRKREAETSYCDLERNLEKLKAELQLREELFREVSHDLKAPLTTIRAFAEILGTLDASERDQARDFQKIIKEETERLAVLVDQVLDLARLEAGHDSISPEEAHPAELIAQVLRLFQARTRASSVNLSSETSPDLPRVFWDRDGILRVLINLVDNALRFIPPEGRVVIRAAPTPAPGPRRVVVEVEDDGPGIPEDKRETVFQRFYTAAPAHGDHRGTGLGLAICQSIIEAHAGSIVVERGELGGALFRILLPLGTN